MTSIRLVKCRNPRVSHGNIAASRNAAKLRTNWRADVLGSTDKATDTTSSQASSRRFSLVASKRSGRPPDSWSNKPAKRDEQEQRDIGRRFIAARKLEHLGIAQVGKRIERDEDGEQDRKSGAAAHMLPHAHRILRGRGLQHVGRAGLSDGHWAAMQCCRHACAISAFRAKPYSPASSLDCFRVDDAR